MIWLSALGIGSAAGVLTGIVTEQVPLPTLIRSVGSAAISSILGAGAMTLIGLRYLLGNGRAGDVSVGVGLDNLLWLLGICLVVAGAHFVAGRVGLPSVIVEHRPVLFGCLAGLFGAFSAASGLIAHERLHSSAPGVS